MPTTITMLYSNFNSALARVAPAMSTEETRYYLNGICLDYTDSTLILVATDGHRLHNVRAAATVAPEEEKFSVILPASFVKMLLKLKPSDKYENITLEINGADVIASLPASGQTISARLINATFPEWRRCVPAIKDAVVGEFAVSYLEAVVKAAKAGKAEAILLHIQERSADRLRGPMVTHDIKGGEYVLMPRQVDEHALAVTKGRAVSNTETA